MFGVIPVLKVLVGAAVVAALTDPAWAGPVNTALIVVLAYLNIRHSQEVKSARQEVRQARDEATDAARIARQLGGAARDSKDGDGEPR